MFVVFKSETWYFSLSSRVCVNSTSLMGSDGAKYRLLNIGHCHCSCLCIGKCRLGFYVYYVVYSLLSLSRRRGLIKELSGASASTIIQIELIRIQTLTSDGLKQNPSSFLDPLFGLIWRDNMHSGLKWKLWIQKAFGPPVKLLHPMMTGVDM